MKTHAVLNSHQAGRFEDKQSLQKWSNLLCLLFSFPPAGFRLHVPINHLWLAVSLVQNLLPCGLDFLNSHFVSTALDYTVTACKSVWNEAVIRKRCSNCIAPASE